MPSQVDLDQGGTARTYNRINLGPSVGWIWMPVVSSFTIVASGIYKLDPSSNFVTVNFNGAGVIIILPTTVPNAAGAQAVPNLFAPNPVTIVDIGGFAFNNNIAIRPFSGSETIMGLGQILINSNFGGYTLAPNPTQLTWNSISP